MKSLNALKILRRSRAAEDGKIWCYKYASSVLRYARITLGECPATAREKERERGERERERERMRKRSCWQAIHSARIKKGLKLSVATATATLDRGQRRRPSGLPSPVYAHNIQHNDMAVHAGARFFRPLADGHVIFPRSCLCEKSLSLSLMYSVALLQSLLVPHHPHLRVHKRRATSPSLWLRRLDVTAKPRRRFRPSATLRRPASDGSPATTNSCLPLLSLTETFRRHLGLLVHLAASAAFLIGFGARASTPASAAVALPTVVSSSGVPAFLFFHQEVISLHCRFLKISQVHLCRNDKGELDPNGYIWGAPYRWGPMVIAYKKEKFRRHNLRPIEDWSDLWRAELAGKVAMVDSSREVIGAVLKYMGSSYNTKDVETQVVGGRKAVLHNLRMLQRQVRLFDSVHYLKAFSSGDVWVAVGWSSDVIPVAKRMSNVAVIVPKSGSSLWADLWV
ncbi:hypothetical protein BHM03_00042956 [Ensete ventricosum]|nr:hypothetical protein BHM03_00042956 [Ensete ventricosum]